MCVIRGDSGWEADADGAAVTGDAGMEADDIMEGCITGEEICSGSGLCVVAAAADGVGCGE